MMNTYNELLTQLDWKKMNGLIPAIVQDDSTRQVLMLGYMNQEALQITCETEEITFFSRSQNRLWRKGETSGNTLTLLRILPDCDQDAILLFAKPQGPTCHLNTPSCFEKKAPSIGILAQLETVIEERYQQRPKNSYVASLFEEGIRRIAQKVGEEGVELSLAGVASSKKEVINEAADLLFHSLILLKERRINLEEVLDELQRRTLR